MMMPAVVAALAVVFFLSIAGTSILNPSHIGWLIKADWQVHFLGWHLFRRESWGLPPGAIRGYLAPLGSAIGYTDSIPLLALPLKMISGLLPPTFQYIGLWLTSCLALQGAFGTRLVQQLTDNRAAQVAGGLLFVLMPTLLARYGHPALSAHWLLLWAMLLYIAPRSQRSLTRQHAAIGLVAGLVHPYIAVMVLLVLIAIVLRERTKSAAAIFAVAVGSVVGGWWASGLFTVTRREDVVSAGLGFFSLNLLGPVIPQGWSSLVPEIATASSGQIFEGFQYFGVGVLLLCVLAATLAIRDRRALLSSRWWRPLAMICAMCALYAVSPRVTIGEWVLFDATTRELHAVTVFRASGRFFWPAAYGTLLAALAIVSTRLRTKSVVIVLCGAALLQVVDLRLKYVELHRLFHSQEFHLWNDSLGGRTWTRILPHYQHLVLYPPQQCAIPAIDFASPAYHAGLHGLTINAGWAAREEKTPSGRYCEELDNDMRAGALRDDTLYLVHASRAPIVRENGRDRIVCGVIDALPVCATVASYAAWRDIAELR